MNIQLKDVDNVVFNGIDVSAVKFNDVLVWRKWETIEYTGAVPVEIYANGEPLIDYLISGNMQQTGTPSPQSIIMPQECGERTGNLFDKNSVLLNYEISENSIKSKSGWAVSDYIPVSGGTTYASTSVGSNALVYSEIGGASTQISKSGTVFTVPSGAKFMRINLLMSNLDVAAINLGSTPLPYSPYGYKLDISSGGENLAWTGWAEDFVSRVTSSYPPPYIVGDILNVYANNGYGHYNTQYLFTTNWKENTQYTANLEYLRDTEYSNGAMLAFEYTDGTRNTFGNTINDGEWHNIYVTSAANKTIKNIQVWYSSGWIQLKIDKLCVYEGIEQKPYSPYNRTTTPIYLGEVPTTRNIKKLVLTGAEEWQKSSGGYNGFYFYMDALHGYPKPKLEGSPLICNIATYSSTNYYYINYPWYCVSDRTFAISTDSAVIGGTTVADWKAYLAQQYANGTPVCVWYVLANPTTGIVNEPLRKIGDYADTISAEQAGVSIPTVEGANVIDINTALKPSEVYIKYKGKST